MWTKIQMQVLIAPIVIFNRQSKINSGQSYVSIATWQTRPTI